MGDVIFRESSLYACSSHFASFSIRNHKNEPIKVTDQIARTWWPRKLFAEGKAVSKSKLKGWWFFFYRTPCTHPFGRPSADERQGPSFPGKRRRLWSCSPFENKTTETTHERGGTSKGSVYVGRGSWSDGQWTLFSRLPSPHPFHHDRSSRRPRCCSAEVGRLRRAIRRRSCPSGRVYRVSRKLGSRENSLRKLTSNW